MAVKANQKRRRTRLYAENPYCPECGILMVLPEDVPKTKNGRPKYDPRNLCTLEHPVTRFEPEKRKASRGMLTILCKNCNEKAAREVEVELGIDVLRERSNN